MRNIKSVVIAGIALIGLVGCGQGETVEVSGFNNAACASGSCVTVPILFKNPVFSPGTTAGGGIVGDPVRVKLPVNKSTFHIHIDGGLGLLAWDETSGVDSSVYGLRMPALIVVSPEFAVYTMNSTTGNYTVPAGANVDLYPIWQTVTDTPSDYTIQANQVGVLVEIFY